MEKKEAMKILKDFYDKSALFLVRTALDTIIPGLKESEDEKIRKELLEHCKNQAKPYIQTGNKCPQIQSWITWLEKQGERKPANKVEPKFKIGDTIVEKDFDECGYGTIKDIKDGQYIFTDGSGNGCHNATPATKEQRDTLMKAMADAGFTFYFDKKELKKITKNPTWSEEDEDMLNRLIGVLDGTNTEDYHEGWTEKFLPLLKSIKERVQPQNT